jgi:hypothetical protein
MDEDNLELNNYSKIDFQIRPVQEGYLNIKKDIMEFRISFFEGDQLVGQSFCTLYKSQISDSSLDAKYFINSQFNSTSGITFYCIDIEIQENRYISTDKLDCFKTFTYYGRLIIDDAVTLIKVKYIDNKIYFYSLTLEGDEVELLFSGTYYVSRNQLTVNLDPLSTFNDSSDNIVFTISSFSVFKDTLN